MKKKKHLLFFIDTLTAILLTIYFQSTMVLMLENFSYLKNYTWQDYLSIYIVYGIARFIDVSLYRDIYPWIQFIVFCLNIYAAMVKLKDINNKELVKGIYSYFLVFNVAFVVIKALEFCVNWYIITSA